MGRAIGDVFKLSSSLMDDAELDAAKDKLGLHGLLVPDSPDKPAILLCKEGLIVYDPAKHSKWVYYDLSDDFDDQKIISWTLARDGSLLWGINDDERKLLAFDPQKGEVTYFQHYIDYEEILYANEDKVIVRCDSWRAIDIIKLQNDYLKRIAKLSIPRIDSLSSERRIIENSIFLPEKAQFFIIEKIDKLARPRFLRRVSLDGQLDETLRLDFKDVSFCLPYLVMPVWSNNQISQLVYIDLRDQTLQLRTVDVQSLGILKAYSHKFFAFNDELIVRIGEKGNYTLIRLGESPEVLYQGGDTIFKVEQFGPFLVSADGFVYDLTSRSVIKGMPWSSLLRQAIHSTIALQQPSSNKIDPLQSLNLTLNPYLDKEEGDLDSFNLLLRSSPLQDTKFAAYEGVLATQSVSSSSSGNHVCLLTDYGTSVILGDRPDEVQRIFPEPDWRWIHATFDEKGRLWLSDEGEFGIVKVGVIDPENQQAHAFELELLKTHDVDQVVVHGIAAYRDYLAMLVYYEGSTDYFVELFNYKNGLLKKVGSANTKSSPGFIKPDPKEDNSWWLVNPPSRELIHLSIKSKQIKRMRLKYGVNFFGDYPDRVYFAYVDDRNWLHYTLDPNDGWQKVNLNNMLSHIQLGLQKAGMKLKNDAPPDIISMHTVGDDIFIAISAELSDSPKADKNSFVGILVFARLKSDGSSLTPLSLLPLTEKENSIGFLESGKKRFGFTWQGEWLVIHPNVPTTLSELHLGQDPATNNPQHVRMLFYHLPTNRLFLDRRNIEHEQDNSRNTNDYQNKNYDAYHP